jgi:hypothetical protein
MKEIRLKDFIRRAEYSPNSVYRHIERGYRYIPVHPFADETAELFFRFSDRANHGQYSWVRSGTGSKSGKIA